MVAVVGSVGSGKSSLISALLGAMYKTNGHVRLCADRVGFVPQTAFIMSGSVRENIIMGLEMDHERLKTAIESSELAADLEIMKDGLDTIVGERGQTLSGGQKQRIAIARALYCHPQLLILDDPLSAVDPAVANRIMTKGILGFMRPCGEKAQQRALLMVLNQYYFLHHFDLVVVMDEGRIVCQGNVAELRENCHHAAVARVVAAIDSTMRSVVESCSDVNVAVDSDEQKAMNMTEGCDNGKENEIVDSLGAKEKRAQGMVNSKVIKDYFQAMGTYAIPCSFLIGLLAYSAFAGTDLWLAHWVSGKKGGPMGNLENHHRAIIYGALAASHVILLETLSVWNGFSCARAANTLHDSCIARLMRGPLHWYDTTPSGRILSRFSTDLSVTDRFLAFILDDCFQFLWLLFALFVVISILIPQCFPLLLLVS